MIDPSTQDKYSKRVGNLCSDCSVLTASILSDINQVFYADGVEESLSATDLSVRYVTADDYHDLIANVGHEGSKFEPKTLYVVSSDELNAYNTQIKNVGDPIDENDAANKSWVGIQISNAQISAKDYTDELLPILNNKLDRCKDSCIIDSNATISYGDRNVANGNQSIAIGSNVSATGGKSIATGFKCLANGSYSLAMMQESQATGEKSVAIGTYLDANNYRSYVLGNNTKSTAGFQFVWNAISGDKAYRWEPKNKDGSFNINPIDGISGFYIGLSSLDDILNERCIDGMLSSVELCGTQLVFSFNDDASVDPIYIDLSSFDEKTNEVSAFASQISSMLSTKQDALALAQMQAIDSVVDERATTITFDDGTTSSYSWYGTINRTTMQNEGLYDTESSSWISVIQSVSIGTAVSSIGDSAFSRCYSLTSMHVPDSVTKLEQWSLNVCSSLQDIMLPRSITAISSSAFNGCTSLTSITFKDRTLDDVPDGSSTRWGASNAEIYTWNAASQEWVESKLSSISSANELSDEFKKYLSLADGGSLSGDVTIANNKSIVVEDGHIDIANGDISASNGGIYVDIGGINASNGNVNILCGNYIQTTDPERTRNYSSKNAFIQAEEAYSGDGKDYGPAYTGSMGYCILSVVVDGDACGFKLSGDLSKLEALMQNDREGAGIDYDPDPARGCSKTLKTILAETNDISNALFSMALSSQAVPIAYQISGIVGDIVFVKQQFDDVTIKLSALNEEKCIELWNGDDNAFYLAGFPSVGNSIVANFYAQHVEGGSSRAIGKYTHAEGRDCIADVRYAHAEGAHAIAAHMATHAEGFQNAAYGKYSHAEGNQSKTYGIVSHAAGIKAVARNNYSYVWNGVSAEPYDPSKGEGTFCINPLSGLSGFYVGTSSIADVVGAVDAKCDELSLMLGDIAQLIHSL